MKNMYQIFIITLFFYFITACSNADKPSEEFIKEAVNLEMKKGVPGRWINLTISGDDAKISEIKIIKWGKYNNEKNYWPVIVNIKGSAQPSIRLTRNVKAINFNSEGEFYFYKDAYDEWKWKFIRPHVF